MFCVTMQDEMKNQHSFVTDSEGSIREMAIILDNAGIKFIVSHVSGIKYKEKDFGFSDMDVYGTWVQNFDS